MDEYSEYTLGDVEIETEKAFLATIDKFTKKPIWIPKTVVHLETQKIKRWFIKQKDKEVKDFMRPRNQATLQMFFTSTDSNEC